MEIELLGGFAVAVEGRPVNPAAWHRRKPAGLIKLLALTPAHRLHREQLMDRLWPEMDLAEAAAANLRKAVHQARRAFAEVGGVDVLSSDANLVWLHADTLRIDLDEFHRAVAAGRRDRDVDAYQHAVDLYDDGLLPEDRYEDWASRERDSVQMEYLAILEELVALLESRGALDHAIDVVRLLIGADPLREDSHTTLIRLSALAGRRADALRAYERLRTTLAAELGTPPGPTAERLVAEIRSREVLAPELAADVWERVGDLRMLSGDGVGAVKAFGAALKTGVASGMDIRLHRKSADAWLMEHRPDRAADHLSAAEGDGVDAVERSSLLRSRANHAWESGNITAAQRYAELALDVAVAAGAPEDIAAAHEALAIVSHYQGAWRDGLAAELDRLASEDAGPTQLARMFDFHHCIGQYHLYGDGLSDSVEPYARRLLDRAEEAGAVRAQAFAWCLLGEALLLQGRWDESAGCLERSSDLHASLGSRSGALAWQRLAELAVCRGEPGEAEVYLRRASGIATVSAMASHLWGRIYATRAFAALELGDPPRAIAAVRAAAAAAARYGDCPSCSALLNPMAAEALALTDQHQSAQAFAASAQQVGQMFASSAWQAMAESAAGSLALAERDADGAYARFASAQELYARAGQPYWAQRAQRATRGNAQGTLGS